MGAFYLKFATMDRAIDCEYYRRFGVEVELNTLSGEIRKNKYEVPDGADIIGGIVHKATGDMVEVQDYGHNYNNDNWVVKHDGSCGLEVCTPVLKGWRGLKKLVTVVDAFKAAKLSADKRCSLHVHVNIGDLNEVQLASVIAWYIKCEHVFMDSVPSSRKVNRYCQMIGMTDLFEENSHIDAFQILHKVSSVKYFSLNAFHFVQGGAFSKDNTRKKTIEFRIGENEMCLNPFDVKNWVRLLLHFVETTKRRSLPRRYSKGDQWTGLVWLEPRDAFELLGFNEPLSDGMKQVRNWFAGRIYRNGYDTGLKGVWSNAGRMPARQSFFGMIQDWDVDISGEYSQEMLYGEKYIK